MWEIHEPQPVKLIIAILAANERCLQAGREAIADEFGKADLVSETWAFTQTQYYKDELGQNVLRQFVCIEKLIDPGRLSSIKHKTNAMEQDLAEKLNEPLPRPVNLDPGFIEPSKLVLGSTKNFAHRIYIGNQMYAEVTLSYCRGMWNGFEYTFPDYKQDRYHSFLSEVREKLVEQLRQLRKEKIEQ